MTEKNVDLFKPEIAKDKHAQDMVYRWAQALKSGRFRKVIGRLRGRYNGYSVNGEEVYFCVMGALNQIAEEAEEHPGRWSEQALTKPLHMNPDGVNRLVRLNDDGRTSFKAFAEIIENALFRVLHAGQGKLDPNRFDTKKKSKAGAR
jgi:hypothetical protein